LHKEGYKTLEFHVRKEIIKSRESVNEERGILKYNQKVGLISKWNRERK